MPVKILTVLFTCDPFGEQLWGILVKEHLWMICEEKLLAAGGRMLTALFLQEAEQDDDCFLGWRFYVSEMFKESVGFHKNFIFDEILQIIV